MPERPQFELERDAQRKVSRDLLAQKAASSRPGQVYHTMTSLQDRMSRPGYTPARADTDQLKALRRDWNRNQKYTPQGMRVSGATSPLDAQNRFMGATETFRQGNPSAYGRMYPVASTAMKMGEYGGLLGLGVRALTGQLGDYYKTILGNKGIGGALDTNEAELENYANLTYGPHLENVPYGGPSPDVYEGPRPHPEGEEPLLGDFYEDEKVKTREEEMQEYADELRRQIDEGETTAYSDILDDAIRDQYNIQNKGPFDEYVSDRLEKLQNLDQERNDLPVAGEPLTFDEGKADFIRSQNEYVSPPPVFPGNVRQDPQYPTPIIGIEFGKDDLPPIVPYDDPRTESGIANLMPGGPLYDEIPWKQRLNMRIAEEMQRRGPHYREPVTSYYGSNWYDEYKRKMENEMEIAKGIRSPMDR